MKVKEAVNAVLVRRGYMVVRTVQLKTAGRPARARAHRRPTSRLLSEPVFILSTVRSGSTLLRLLLDGHSEIHSPHEMHLKGIDVALTGRYAEKALEVGRLEREEMRNVLWDWYLDRQLSTTGKRLLVNKTPSDVFVADEIRACWGDARFIFLLRHPLAVAQSRARVRPQDSAALNLRKVVEYAEALERARISLPGYVLRYEDLTADPTHELVALCNFLGVAFEPDMLAYGKRFDDPYRIGLGDWMDEVRSGEILPAKPLPAGEGVPEALRPYVTAWGYDAPASRPRAPELERAEG